MSLSILPGLRIAAEKPIHSRSCIIYAWDDHQSIHVDTFTSKEYKPHAVIEPLMTLSIDEGQLLFDALYYAGYRRKDQPDSTGEIEANHGHITDLELGIGRQHETINRLIDLINPWTEDG